MHICLLIDLLTLVLLIGGLRSSQTRSRRLLCLGCLIYLLAIALHYYLVFAPWFGFFERHRSLAALGFTALLDFFGGFWSFFGVMVFARGVSYIALAFMINGFYRWITQTTSPHIALSAPDRDGV